MANNLQPIKQSSWSSSTSQIRPAAAPVPLSFSVPSEFSQTVPGVVNLVDRFTAQFPMQPPLVIPENCSAALHQASFAYSQPNVAGPGILENLTDGNNRLTVNYDAKGDVDILLATGLYSLDDIQSALNVWFRTHDSTGGAAPPGTAIVTGATDLIILSGITATQKVVFSVNPAALSGGVVPGGNIVFSFVNPSPVTALNNSIGEVLGYPTDGSADFTVPAGETTIFSSYAPNTADFATRSAYAIYMSILTNSYVNGSIGQLLYSIPLGNVAPNSVASFMPTLRFPVQTHSGTYSTINVWTADQDGNRLPWAYYQAPFQFSVLLSKNRPDGSL